MRARPLFLACAISVVQLLWTAPQSAAGENCGPVVEIPATGMPVDNPQPECQKTTRDPFKGTADFIRKHGGEDGTNLGDILVDADGIARELGFDPRTQTNANCALICAAYPVGATVKDFVIFWNAEGGRPDRTLGPYDRGVIGQWGPGSGYHRIDPESIDRQDGNLMFYCHNFRNWLHNMNRSAQMCVTY